MAEDRISVSALALLAEQDPQQLQLRAKSLRSLEFAAGDSTYHAAFRDTKFQTLERLVLDASDQNEEHLLKPYLQYALKAFIFFGGPISDRFLETLQESCPQLEELLIDNPRNLISPEGFLNFLKGANCLKRLTIMYGMDRVANDDVFVALATRSDLQSLQSQHTITAELISLAERQQINQHGEARLFPRLEKLVCTATFDGFVRLLPHLRQLAHLEATIISDGANSTGSHTLLQAIPASSPHLRILKLECSVMEQVFISPSELVHLAQGLPHLQQLEISGRVRAPDLESDHMSLISEALPDLKILHLAFECSLTEAALIELGRNCGSHMADCELWGSYALQNLEGSGVFFPVLRDLVLGRLVPPASGNANSQAVNAARLMKELAPNLNSFDVVTEDSFSTLVYECWTG
ncbi:hypothetical protein F5Y00DRAFT_263966 [Daldinia vernicosa]|uniref:uncharacterized protein n=1 Tax=Daldinia vernicosa TaxID=114800 RepID=UPI002007469D|nr:uncharacterized protein F5Y00DRAFT_263966 [Daldinia vernicosa]KAI0846944.1 hypothetical protein F5Y00DRAFT_263966 [Daldinia vernicosa]